MKLHQIGFYWAANEEKQSDLKHSERGSAMLNEQMTHAGVC